MFGIGKEGIVKVIKKLGHTLLDEMQNLFRSYFLFYYEQENESNRQDLYMRIGVMKDSKTKAEESTRLTYTGVCHSCCHTYLETSVSQRLTVSTGLCCIWVVYYKSRKRELKAKLMNESVR
jgi:hypothetical protein